MGKMKELFAKQREQMLDEYDDDAYFYEAYRQNTAESELRNAESALVGFFALNDALLRGTEL